MTITIKTNAGTMQFAAATLSERGDGSIRFSGIPTWINARKRRAYDIINGVLYNWQTNRPEGRVVEFSAASDESCTFGTLENL